MTNRKNYNSILFLTVYLGLVLVGGSAQVLAHAATNSLFDIRNEFEIKEDLDNKPDENDLIAESIIGIINDLDKLSKSNKFNWKNKSSLIIEELNFCKSDNSPAYSGSWSPNITKKIGEIIEKHNVQIGRNLNKLKSDSGLGDFYSGYPEGITFNLLTESKTLNLEIKINIKDGAISHKFFDLVNSSIFQKKSSAKSSKQSLIYENTKVSFSNNQVFIVTRLPRGSIDSLLK